MVVAMFGCLDEDHFGLNEYGRIKSFLVSNQAGVAKINNDSLTITVEIPSGVDLSSLRIEELELSSFATSDKIVGDLVDLNDEQKIIVTSESGIAYEWNVISYVASAEPQLDNADLNLWYKTSGNYYEPGADAASTIWATGNQGTYLMGKLATVPFDRGDDNLAAQMITLDTGVLGSIAGAPLAAGSLYTGVFNIDKLDPSDPMAAIEFGTPFTGRPTSMRFSYSYVPGATNKDKDGNTLDYGDACELYAFLEVRSEGQVQRLATAWFKSDELTEEWTEGVIEFIYGTLDSSYPSYLMPDGNNFVDEATIDYALPTHITIVASSSFDGVNFTGAVDSEFILDDLVMVYE